MKLKKLSIGVVLLSAVFGLASCVSQEPNPDDQNPVIGNTEYNVIFDTQNGSYVPNQKIQSGNKVERPADPYRTGYSFEGWFKEATCENLFDFNKEIITSETTIYAKWVEDKESPVVPPVQTYSITYVTEHGTSPAKVENVKAIPTTLPTLTDSNYNFDGWFTNEARTEAAVPGATISANTTLYAKWTEKTVTPPADTYSILYITEHGTTPEPVVGATALPTKLPELTEEGWTFVGWYTNEARTILAVAGTQINADATLYAKWIQNSSVPNTYSIIYITEHGTTPEPIVGATAIPTTLPTLTDTNYDFVGWFTNEARTEAAVAGATISANTTLYAKWTEKTVTPPADTYSITYVTEHGTTPIKVNNVTKLPTTLPILTEEGWTFDGWYTNEGKTEKAVAGATITANTTLYAKWTEKTVTPPLSTYNISFVINGHGNEPQEIQNVSHIPTELPVLSTTDNYTFGGWYLDAACTKYAEAGTLLTEHTTLYAKWYIKSSIEITKYDGHLETAYLEWKKVDGATDYNVYYKKASENDDNYVEIDKMLIREYANYYRADVLGLEAGSYTLKVAPVFNQEEFNGSYANVTVMAHDRSGFGFSKESLYKTSSGAYNDNGTLKAGAQVIYVTASNAKTVEATINGATVKGFQSILDAKQKKGNTDILDIRLVGEIKRTDLDHISSSAEGIQIKGADKYQNMYLTIEGVGEDATVNGFGFLIRNCGNVEMRNFGIVNFMDDGVSIDTDNRNLWIHNLDIFYGNAGGDSDQAKGDGSLDIKKSQYITASYNHFWDSGKCCLLDASAATTGGSNYITYHHNWFDHSDSRHPRVRNASSVHVYNNYFDGNSKYGIGASVGGSILAEANYFRNVKFPMLTSKQGSDMLDGKGVFSGENGGFIKAVGNEIVGGTFSPYSETNTVEFDAYVASDINEVVPSTITSKVGSQKYSNFDTESTMYSYVADAAADVPTIVSKYAGRINGGDLKYDFNDSEQDTNYGIIPELKQMVVNYKTSLVRVLGNSSSGSSTGGNTGGTTTPETPDNPSIEGEVTHDFTSSGTSSSVFNITGNLTTISYEYNGTTYTKGLKMESSTSIVFTITKDMTLLIITNTPSKKIKVNNESQTTNSNGVVEMSLTSGTYTISKGDQMSLVLIVLK